MDKANPINILGIDHVVVRARDPERLVRFYRDVLGCRLERGPGKEGLAQLRAGRSLIDIVDAGGPLGHGYASAPDRDAPNMDHFCVEVRPWDADAIRAHLEAAGVDVGAVQTRYGAKGNGPSIYLEDPEGNTIELKGR
jgi:glyoxylase I family protein